MTSAQTITEIKAAMSANTEPLSKLAVSDLRATHEAMR